MEQAVLGGRGGTTVYGNSLYFALNFAVNLIKFLLKNKVY